jgi:hypothetical protein
VDGPWLFGDGRPAGSGKGGLTQSVTARRWTQHAKPLRFRDIEQEQEIRACRRKKVSCQQSEDRKEYCLTTIDLPGGHPLSVRGGSGSSPEAAMRRDSKGSAGIVWGGRAAQWRVAGGGNERRESPQCQNPQGLPGFHH